MGCYHSDLAIKLENQKFDVSKVKKELDEKHNKIQTEKNNEKQEEIKIQENIQIKGNGEIEGNGNLDALNQINNLIDQSKENFTDK